MTTKIKFLFIITTLIIVGFKINSAQCSAKFEAYVVPRDDHYSLLFCVKEPQLNRRDPLDLQEVIIDTGRDRDGVVRVHGYIHILENDADAPDEYDIPPPRDSPYYQEDFFDPEKLRANILRIVDLYTQALGRVPDSEMYFRTDEIHEDAHELPLINDSWLKDLRQFLEERWNVFVQDPSLQLCRRLQDMEL